MPLRPPARRLAALALALLLALAVAPTTATAARAPDQRPVALRIDRIGVAAPVEVRTTVEHTMQDPTGPEVVAWYDDSAKPGAPGNAVFAGHLDFAGHGPAVFARLNELRAGDVVEVAGRRGGTFRYRVVWSRAYEAASGPWVELTGPTARQALTLITCAGPWDPALGHYRDRLVVRAVRIRE